MSKRTPEEQALLDRKADVAISEMESQDRTYIDLGDGKGPQLCFTAVATIRLALIVGNVKFARLVAEKSGIDLANVIVRGIRGSEYLKMVEAGES